MKLLASSLRSIRVRIFEIDTLIVLKLTAFDVKTTVSFIFMIRGLTVILLYILAVPNQSTTCPFRRDGNDLHMTINITLVL